MTRFSGQAPADDSFVAFSEWGSDADELAYGKL